MKYKPNSESFQLRLDNLLVAERFEDIQHNEDEVGSPGHSDDLSSSTLSVLGSFNNSWQVEQLDLRTLVLDTPGDGGQGGELVGRHLAVHPGQVGQQGGLPHGRKAHKPNPTVSSLSNLKALDSARAAL